MSDETNAGDAGENLTVEDVAARYSARKAEAAKPEAERKAPEKAAAPVKDDEPEEIEPESADEGDGDEENIAEALETEPTTTPNIEMPPGWGEADKGLWAGLTPDAQQKLLTREKQRELGFRQRIQKADEAVKAKDAELAQAKSQQRSGPSASVAQQMIIADLVRDFPDVNPQDPNSLMKLALESPERKVAFDEKWRQLGKAVHDQKMQEQQQAAESDKAQAEFETTRAQELRELRPDLADEKNSAKFETEVVGYLTKDNGVEIDRIKHYSAAELLMADKARKFDKAMAGLKVKPQADLPKVVKAGAPGDGGKTDTVVALEKRARRTGKPEDVLALRRARQAASA